MKIVLLANLVAFVTDLVTSFTRIKEIWLSGSRAEGIAGPASDSDLIAVSRDRLTADMLTNETRLRPEYFDLFIANGDEFVRPWPRQKDGVIKRGGFSRWQWAPESVGQAFYTGNVDKPRGRSGRKPAIRIWSRAGGAPGDALRRGARRVARRTDVHDTEERMTFPSTHRRAPMDPPTIIDLLCFVVCAEGPIGSVVKMTRAAEVPPAADLSGEWRGETSTGSAIVLAVHGSSGTVGAGALSGTLERAFSHASLDATVTIRGGVSVPLRATLGGEALVGTLAAQRVAP